MSFVTPTSNSTSSSSQVRIQKRKRPAASKVRAPKAKELKKLEQSPPSLQKEMTDEELAKFLQEQEELLLRNSLGANENQPLNFAVPQLKSKMPSKAASEDEQLAWRLQMEEEYYEQLLLNKEGPTDGDVLELEPSNNQLSNDFFQVEAEDSEENDSFDLPAPSLHFGESAPFETYESLLHLDQIAPPVSKGVKEEALNLLGSVELTAEDVKQFVNCNICFEDFEEKESCRKLPCAHVYHVGCIDQWLKDNKICPVCRTEINQN